MGCRVLYSQDDDVAVLYDSVTETAFGPLFNGDDPQEEAEAFIKWCGKPDDPRSKSPAQLSDSLMTFRERYHTCDLCGSIGCQCAYSDKMCVGCDQYCEDELKKKEAQHG